MIILIINVTGWRGGGKTKAENRLGRDQESSGVFQETSLQFDIAFVRQVKVQK